jgi:hypothetical protein
MAAHVEQCAGCREIVVAQSAVSDALDAWEPGEVSADFNRRLYDRIERDAARSWWAGLFPAMPAFRPAAAMAAMFLVLAAGVLFRTPEPVAVDKASAVESIDVDQLENMLDDMEMLRQLGVIPMEETAL